MSAKKKSSGRNPESSVLPKPVIAELPGVPLPPADTELNDPALILNRELCWLEFNRRVLEEAQDPLTPAMERLKFLSIFSSNLDEFFMIRVGSLARLVRAGLHDPESAGRPPTDQLRNIAAQTQALVSEQYQCLNKTVLPLLEQAGVRIVSFSSLGKAELAKLEHFFLTHVLPVLTPLAVDVGHPFPFLGNLKLNLYVQFESMSPDLPPPFAFLEVPAVLPRMIPLERTGPGHDFLLLEDLIQARLAHLFPGLRVTDCFPFRITRNLDYDLHENEVMDLLQSVEAELRDLSHQVAVRVEVAQGTSAPIIQKLTEHFGLDRAFVFEVNGPINLTGLMPLYGLMPEAGLHDPPFNPRIPPRLASNTDMFEVISEGEVLLHHPYDSFAAVVEFLFAAADDPNVLAIKQTLYRTGRDSPIVAALIKAAQNGKQVTAVLELKARFDEQFNIDLSSKMRDAGINLVYGFVHWKVHCKATLIVRRESGALKRYVHLATGNYNTSTARLYTDLGLLSADPVMGEDVSALFNVLTGFNSWTAGETFSPTTVAAMFKKISLAPVNLDQKFLRMIEREVEKTGPKQPGRIIAKMNALTDTTLIRALYKASQAGVQIDLIVRGMCCLRPGIPGISDNIRVTSILDRFLEHSRITYFHNGGEPEIFLGSADWMPRNLVRRVEVIFPIENTELKTRIIKEILFTYLKDNVKAREMLPDGRYRRVEAEPGKKPVRSQSKLIAIAREGGVKSPPYEELVRRLGKKKQRKL